MNQILQFWNTTIVSTNTFNFIVMVILLAWIFKKVNIIAILEKARENVINTIEKSKSEQLAAKEKLTAAEELVKNLDNEIAEQLDCARQQGEFLHTNISNDTEKRIANITGNVDRVVQSEEKTISTRLRRKTSAAAVSTAENHIRTILRNSPELHDKYIRESIEELDRIQL